MEEKAASKPYPHPKTDGWLSKLFFASLFPIHHPGQQSQRDHDVEVAPPQRVDGRCDSSTVSKSSKGAYIDEVPESLRISSEPGEHGNVKQISKIEQLIKGNTFSRDKIDHLIEILNSKSLDVHEAKRGLREIVAASTAIESGGPLLTHQRRQENNNRAILGASHHQLKVADEIGASPVDIIKDFMGSRKLEPCPTPPRVSGKAENTLQLVESATKALICSPTPMSSTHWPGVMVDDRHGYVTLRCRNRYRLHNFLRTPYYRTIYTKSRPKPPADSRYPSNSSSFFQNSRTPICGQQPNNSILQQSNNSTGSGLQKETSEHQIVNMIYAQNHNFMLSKKPAAEFSSPKPVLSSITISKPDFRRTVSSNISKVSSL